MRWIAVSWMMKQKKEKTDEKKKKKQISSNATRICASVSSVVSNPFGGKIFEYEEPSKELFILLIFVPRTKETDQPVEFVNKYFIFFIFKVRLIHFTINTNTLIPRSRVKSNLCVTRLSLAALWNGAIPHRNNSLSVPPVTIFLQSITFAAPVPCRLPMAAAILKNKNSMALKLLPHTIIHAARMNNVETNKKMKSHFPSCSIFLFTFFAIFFFSFFFIFRIHFYCYC